ncbi:MAG: helix-turn-helix domain-containing protein [Vallitalea sp.]|jgi:transcriptional regulator with XRE-family HTH domain|nr:helix-turn-helix domain-containing protein [Vallitalea sp.]
MKDKIIDLKELGKNVRKYRLEEQLTQEKLAGLTNLSIQYIGNIERGKTTASLETIMKICEALKITPNHLLISSSDITPNVLMEQISISLSNHTSKFHMHILKYIDFLEESDII